MRDAMRKLRADRFEDIIALVALYRPGPMENIPNYIDCKHGARAGRLPASLARSRSCKETYGVIIYQEQVMQIAQVLSGYTPRRRRPAAPRHGQEDQGGDGRRSATRSSKGAVARGVEEAQAVVDLRPGRQVRRLRLQQVARRRLRAGRLPDRLPEGQLPGRVPRRVDDLRPVEHRQAQRLPPGPRPAAASSCCRPTSTARSRNSRSSSRQAPSAARSATRWPPRAASASRRWRRWSPSASAAARSRT